MFALWRRFGNLEDRHDVALVGDLTVANSDRLMPIIGEILLRIRRDRSSFFVFSRAAYETSLAISAGLQEVVEPWLANERVTRRGGGLNALSLQRLSQSKNDAGPGALHVPLQVLAWQGIDVVDVISTSNEVVLILRDSDVERAICVLRPTLHTSSEQHANGK